MLAYVKSFNEDYEIGKTYNAIVPYYHFLEDILEKFGICHGIYKIRVSQSDISGSTNIATEFTVMEEAATRHYVEEICLFRHSYQSLKNVLEWFVKQNYINETMEITQALRNDIYIGLIFPILGKYATLDMYSRVTGLFSPNVFAESIFLEACKSNKIQIVEIMFYNKDVLPYCDLRRGMRDASRYGSLDVVNFLLTNSNEEFDNCCIGMASEYGHYHVVKALLKCMDPTDGDNYSFRRACGAGHYNIVKLLLAEPHVNPSARNNEALSVSVTKNDVHMVKILMKSERLVNINKGLLYKVSQITNK